MFSTSSDSKMVDGLSVCPKCGSKFNYQAQFCEKCGANIEKQKVLNEQKNDYSANTKSGLSNNLQGQIQIISVIEIAFGLVGILASIVIGIISPFMPDAIKYSNTESITYSNQFLQFLVVIMATLAVIMFIVSSAIVFVGYKLYKLENIGRLGSMVVSALSLLMVPFGTIFGIISLVLLTKPETIEMFKEKN